MPDQLQHLEIKISALGKTISGLQEELEVLKKPKPQPPARRNLKAKRIEEIAAFYAKRQVKRGV